LLLQLRADIKTVNNEGATPLDMALKSKNKHMVSVLQAHVSSDLSRGNIARASAKEALSASGTSIKKKEESLVVDGNGNTDLHLAVERPNKYVVELLKKKVRADVSIANNDGDTPLHLAAKKKRVVFVRTLLAKGADASIRNRNGKTPMDVAPTNKMKALFEKKTPKCKKNKK
jgi:ankyrin repeat protein